MGNIQHANAETTVLTEQVKRVKKEKKALTWCRTKSTL